VIETRIKETLSNAVIKTIERIQAKKMFEKYAMFRDIIASKNKGNPNELFLFHGTSGTSPSVIYEGEGGFDMRFCSAGMWGVATYFAVNAR
jgi:hypothetical protein